MVEGIFSEKRNCLICVTGVRNLTEQIKKKLLASTDEKSLKILSQQPSIRLHCKNFAKKMNNEGNLLP